MQSETKFQSTLPLRGVTRGVRLGRVGDLISIHALHEESDEFVVSSISSQQKFQSTLSMRRATFDVERCDHLRGRISIHALHEESDPLCCSTTPRSIFQSTLSMRRATIRVSPYRHAAFISIHALHEESDRRPHHRSGRSPRFQSTLSMRRATSARSSWHTSWPRFQSTLSMRRATFKLAYPLAYDKFQSTLSMRRATQLQRADRTVPQDFNPRSP